MLACFLVFTETCECLLLFLSHSQCCGMKQPHSSLIFQYFNVHTMNPGMPVWIDWLRPVKQVRRLTQHPLNKGLGKILDHLNTILRHPAMKFSCWRNTQTFPFVLIAGLGRNVRSCEHLARHCYECAYMRAIVKQNCWAKCWMAMKRCQSTLLDKSQGPCIDFKSKGAKIVLY